MRIAVANWSNRRFGGTGTYLAELFGSLERLGHQVGLLHERDAPLDHPRLQTGIQTPVWNIEKLGIDRAIDALCDWKPDILFSHGFLDPHIEGRTLDAAPAVFFAHDFYGTCISGFKMHRRPTTQPCDRVLGWRCLAEYHVRGCGGWSPVSMVREFHRQSSRLERLRGYRAIVTHSDRMREEYVRHGFEPTRVVKVPYGVASGPTAANAALDEPRHSDERWRLLFVGRMYTIKGGRELIDALPRVVARLQRRVHVTFAGDGAQKSEWEGRAAALQRREPMIEVEFTGWLQQEELRRLYGQTDLVVMPSLWPEPFGLVGSEAGLYGVPVAAFAVGGIPDWLQAGVNGHLASGHPPTVSGLAEAIIDCLRDDETHGRLREGARRVWSKRTFEHHLSSLLDVFEGIRRAA